MNGSFQVDFHFHLTEELLNSMLQVLIAYGPLPQDQPA